MTTPNVFYSHYLIHPIAITSHDHTWGILLTLPNPPSIVITSTWPNPRSFTPTAQSTQLPSPHMISTANKGQKISDVWKFGPKSVSQKSCTISVSKIWNESWGVNLSDTASRILMKKWFVVWTLDLTEICPSGKKKLVKWREIRWPYSKEVDKICIYVSNSFLRNLSDWRIDWIICSLGFKDY